MKSCPETADITAELRTRLQQIRQRVALACQASGRDPAQINLLAVSKTQSAARVAAMAALGVHQFGENYWQEAQAKQQLLSQQAIVRQATNKQTIVQQTIAQQTKNQPMFNHATEQPLAITWHFIGALQSNKAKVIAQHFAWVHSVCASAMAEKLSAARDPKSTPLQVCVQVNLDREVSKQGMTPEVLDEAIERMMVLPNICVRGLMLLPAQAQDDVQRLARFNELADLLAQTRQRYASTRHPLDTLSMGMSEDLELAVAAGSHWLRIGSALFGPRLHSSEPAQLI